MGVNVKTAAINELKARLSDYLALVKGGNKVLITDRGNPVAYIVPVSTSKKQERIVSPGKATHPIFL